MALDQEEERARRIGMNEALFRKVNEEMRDLSRRFDVADEDLLTVCECGYAECHQRLRVPLADYERARAEPSQFIVAPGHELEEVEEVVKTGDSFTVVAKRPGVPERVAEATDPRST